MIFMPAENVARMFFFVITILNYDIIVLNLIVQDYFVNFPQFISQRNCFDEV